MLATKNMRAFAISLPTVVLAFLLMAAAQAAPAHASEGGSGSSSGATFTAPLAASSEGDKAATASAAASASADASAGKDAAAAPAASAGADATAQLTCVTNSAGEAAISGYTGSEASVTIPATIDGHAVVAIADGAFQGNTTITSLTLPASVTSVGASSFAGCTKLASITLPEGLAYLGGGAFADCTALTSVAIPASLVSCGTTWGTAGTYGPFGGCTALTTVTLAKGSAQVAANLLAGCTAVASLVLPESVTQVGAGAIDAAAIAAKSLTVRGVPGSYAQTYAEGAGLAFADEVVHATSAALDKTAAKTEVGTTVQLTATIAPAEHTDAVTWASSNESVATVSAAGLVSARAAGSATITVTAGSVSASCELTVVQPVTSVTLNKTTLTLEATETRSLISTVAPDDATNKDLVWTSSNEKVAKVDTSGVVTAVGKGRATITATAADGYGAKASVTVDVTNDATIATSVSEMASPAGYGNDKDDIWIYTLAGATSVGVTFDARTAVESGFDFIDVYDGQGQLFGRYTGTELAGATLVLSGDTVKVKYVTDANTTGAGFAIASVVAVQDSGWKVIDGITYYYIDGEPARGELLLADGWHYFNENTGAMITGLVTLPDGRIVYYDARGVMQHGEVLLPDGWHYFDEIDGHMHTGFTVLPNGCYRYYDYRGCMRTGDVWIGGYRYHFGDTGDLVYVNDVDITNVNNVTHVHNDVTNVITNVEINIGGDVSISINEGERGDDDTDETPDYKGDDGNGAGTPQERPDGEVAGQPGSSQADKGASSESDETAPGQGGGEPGKDAPAGEPAASDSADEAQASKGAGDDGAQDTQADGAQASEQGNDAQADGAQAGEPADTPAPSEPADGAQASEPADEPAASEPADASAASDSADGEVTGEQGADGTPAASEPAESESADGASGEAEAASPINLAVSDEGRVTCDYLSFDLPASWVGRVDVAYVAAADSAHNATIDVTLAGRPDAMLARFTLASDAEGEPAGDVGTPCLAYWGVGDGTRVVLWQSRATVDVYALVVGAPYRGAELSDAEQAELVSLMSDGAATVADVAACADTEAAAGLSSFAIEAILPTVKVPARAADGVPTGEMSQPVLVDVAAKPAETAPEGSGESGAATAEGPAPGEPAAPDAAEPAEAGGSEEPGAPALATVPDVMGMTDSEASAALMDARLGCSIAYDVAAPDETSAGRVYAIEPGAGSEVADGGVVTLYCYGAYVAPEPTPIELTQEQQEKAEALACAFIAAAFDDDGGALYAADAAGNYVTKPLQNLAADTALVLSALGLDAPTLGAYTAGTQTLVGDDPLHLATEADGTPRVSNDGMGTTYVPLTVANAILTSVYGTTDVPTTTAPDGVTTIIDGLQSLGTQTDGYVGSISYDGTNLVVTPGFDVASAAYPAVSIKVANVSATTIEAQFDCIVSFASGVNDDGAHRVTDRYFHVVATADATSVFGYHLTSVTEVGQVAELAQYEYQEPVTEVPAAEAAPVEEAQAATEEPAPVESVGFAADDGFELPVEGALADGEPSA